MPPTLATDRRTVRSAGATLVAESIGNPDHPALLLLGGATWSMDWWSVDLCRLLAEHELRVIRYDQRDTGGSTASPVGEPAYGPDDLAADAVALLDAFGVRHAHLLGFSMGGGTAQRLAAHHPARVSSLVLVSTSPAGDVDRELPRPAPAVLASFEQPGAEPDWSDDRAVTAWVVEGERPYAGPGRFDEPALEELVRRVVDRTTDMAAATTNHVVAAGRAAREVVMADITAPTLVVHGSHDPLFPLAHGEALAQVLRAGPVVVLPRTGHQVPPPDTWPTLAAVVAEHARDAERPREDQVAGSRPTRGQSEVR